MSSQYFQNEEQRAHSILFTDYDQSKIEFHSEPVD